MTIKSETDFMLNFICYLIGLWQEGLKDPSSKVATHDIFKDPKPLKLTKEWLRPLLHALKYDQLSEVVFNHMKGIFNSCYVSEYDIAQKEYVQMMIGNVKWHMEVCHGEARHNKGYNYRKVKADGGERLFDDEMTKNYCLAVKRLMTFSQLVRPHDDISHHISDINHHQA